MKRFLRIITLAAVCVLLVGLLVVRAQAAETAISGTCGDDLTWEISGTTLTITGTGPMTDYPYASHTPWYAYRDDLTSVVVGEGVTTIGDNAFCYCTYLTGVSLPSTLESIGDYAFSENRFVTGIDIPESVTYIGKFAFYYCARLTGVTLPASLETLDYGAFKKCASLVSIAIPDSVIYMGKAVFAECTSLKSATLPAWAASVPEETFSKCESLTSITIPRNVGMIYVSAFDGCQSLEQILVEDGNPAYVSVDGVLFDRQRTTLLRFPQGRTGHYTIPAGTKAVGDHAFSGCYLQSVTMNEDLESIGHDGFYASDLTSVVIPDSVTTMGISAFAYCRELFSATIGSGLTELDNNAFNGCSSLRSIVIPDNITEFGWRVFGDCTSLRQVTLPNNLTSISSYAFVNCGLTSVTIPACVTAVVHNAFDDCTDLASVFFLGNAPSVAIAGNPSRSFPQTATLYYFSNTSVWSTPTWNGDACHPILAVGDSTLRDTDYYSTLPDRHFSFANHNRVPLDQVTMAHDGGSISSGAANTLTAKLSGSGQLTFTREGYRPVTLPMGLLSTFNTVRLWPTSYSKPFAPVVYARHGERGGYTNLLETAMSFRAGSLTETTTFYIDADWNGKTAGKLYLSPSLQPADGVQVTEGYNAAQTISTSLKEGGSLYLLLVDSANTVHAQKLNVVIQKEKLTVDVDMGQAIEIPKPDDNFFTKFELNIDLTDKWSTTMTIEKDGTVKIALGVDVAKEEDVSQVVDSIRDALIWSDTKENLGDGGLRNLDNQMKSLINRLKQKDTKLVPESSTMAVEGSAEIIGYAIGKIVRQPDGSLGILYVECKAAVKMTGAASATWQLYAGSVPFYVGAGVELNTEVGLTLFRIGAEGGLLPDPLELKSELILKVRGGLGWDSIASLGVYGKGTLTLETALPVAEESLFLYANASFGAEAKVFCLSGDLEIYKTNDFYLYPWNYKPQSSSRSMSIQSLSVNSDWQPQSRDYLRAAPAETIRYSVTGADTMLDAAEICASVYPYADAQTAALPNKRQIAVWTADPGETARPEANNRTMLYFSRWDGLKWTKPAPVEAADDGTADFAPVLKVLNKEVYLFWQDAARPLTGDDTAAATAAVTDFSVAKFDGSKFVSLGSVGTEHYDGAADLTLLDGQPALCWASNSANDPFGQSGTCSLHRAVYNGESWDVTTFASGMGAIDQVTAEGDQIWFSSDTDKNPQTLSDREIFHYNGQSILPLTGNAVADTNPRVVDGSLCYYSDGNIIVNGETVPFTADSDDYQYLRSDSGMETVVWVTDDDVRASTLYASFNDGTGWGEPIAMTGVSGNIGSFSACFRTDGTLAIVACERGLDESASNFLSGAAKLNLYTVRPYCDLAIAGADYIQHTLAAGEELGIQVQVENKGMTAANVVKVEVLNGSEVLASSHYRAGLLSGQQDYLYVNVPMPDPIPYTGLMVKVTAEGYTEADESDNAQTIALRLTDVSIESTQATSNSSGTTVVALVANRGQMALSGFDVTLYDTDGTTPLDTRNVAGLAAGESAFVTFTLAEQKENASILTVGTAVLENENIEANNTAKTMVEAQPELAFRLEGSLQNNGGGIAVTASVSDPTGTVSACDVIFAAYDASDRLLGLTRKHAASLGEGEVLVQTTFAGGTQIGKVKIFALDAGQCPITGAVTLIP